MALIAPLDPAGAQPYRYAVRRHDFQRTVIPMVGLLILLWTGCRERPPQTTKSNAPKTVVTTDTTSRKGPPVFTGTYRSYPVLSEEHIGSIEPSGTDSNRFIWKNQAGRKWTLVPDLENGVLKTGPDNPLAYRGVVDFTLDVRKGEFVGFLFGDNLFVKDDSSVVPRSKETLSTLPPAKPWAPNPATDPNQRQSQGLQHRESMRYPEAVEEFRNGIAEGVTPCLDELGWLYLTGQGVTKSPRLAYACFLQAAQQGNPNARRNLGYQLFLGEHPDLVPPDPELAAFWWQRGMEAGEPQCAFQLANLLYTGNGIPQDQVQARECWKTAAALAGESRLQVQITFAQLADRLFTGKLTGTDRGQLSKFAREGNKTAASLLKYESLRERGEPLIENMHFIKQAHDFSGIASGTMLLQCAETKATQLELAGNRRNRRSTRWHEIIHAAKNLGTTLRVESFETNRSGYDAAVQRVVKLLQGGQPVAIAIQRDRNALNFHTVLAIGYDTMSKEFLMADPAEDFPGLRIVDAEEMERLWHSRGYSLELRKPKRGIMYVNKPGEWHDLLPTITPEALQSSRGWTLTDKGLLSPDGAVRTLIFPTPLTNRNYELRINLERDEPIGGLVVNLPVGRHAVSLFLDKILSDENGNKKPTSGLGRIEGRSIEREPTKLIGLRMPKGQHTVLIQVNLNEGIAQISATLNDAPLIKWKGPSTSLQLHRHLPGRSVPTDRSSLTSWNKEWMLSAIHVRILSGEMTTD